MRFRELLLEYDRAKTVAAFRAKLWARLSADSTAQVWMQGVDNSLRPGNPNALSSEEMLDHVMLRFENADNTRNKKNVRWMIAMYVNGKIARLEDLYRARSALTQLEILKDYGYFKKEPGLSQRGIADLSKGHSLREIESFLSTVPDDEFESQADRDRANAALMAGEDQATILYNDEKWKIVTPLTQLAASFYGKNTKWCTASENGGMFENYNRQGPLFIILDKPNNRRWQFHFETDQFMDERDDAVPFDKIPSAIWGLIDWPVEKMIRDAFMPLLVQIPNKYKEKMCKKVDQDILLFVMACRVNIENDAAYAACKKTLLDQHASNSFAARIVIGGNEDFTRRSLDVPVSQYDKIIHAIADGEKWIVTEASLFQTVINALVIGDDKGALSLRGLNPSPESINDVFELRYEKNHIRASKFFSSLFKLQINNNKAVVCDRDEMRELLADTDFFMDAIGPVSEPELREGLDILVSHLSLWRKKID